MSAQKEVKAEYFDYKNVGSSILFSAGAAIVLLAVAWLWPIFDPAVRDQFAFSWLFAYMFFFTISMGGLFWQLVHYGTNAEWSTVVRRQMENMAGLVVVMVIMFLPLIFVRERLWEWMTIDPKTNELLKYKQPYLTGWFFWIRTVFYFVFFVIAALWFKRNSILQDLDGNPKYTVWQRRLAFACMPLFAVALTFSAIDWLMTMQFEWFSTMWGVYIFAGTAVSSISTLVIIMALLRSAGYLKGVLTLEHFHIMGKLMLAFTVFWAYIAFSQYMLIWYADIPEENFYYLWRNTGSWNTLQYVLVVGHFFIPFVLLLQQPLKKKPFALSMIAVWILLMHLLDLYIIVMPVLHRAGFAPSVFDLLCLLAIGCAVVAVFLKKIGENSLFPVKDPRIQDSIHLHN